MRITDEKKLIAQNIHSVSDLEWLAKILSAGFIQGKHNSARLDIGLEFQQFRPYVQGDDIRAIDWKMYAKTEKYYIRQAITETEHNFQFILDNSKSMLYAENGVSKLLLGKILTAAMSNIMVNQGDKFSWVAGEKNIPAGTGIRHWNRSLNDLYELDSSEADAKVLPVNRENLILIWITDGYYSMKEINEYLSFIKNVKTEVILFHITGLLEKALDFPGNSTFVDLESGEQIELNPTTYKKIYVEQLLSHFHQIRNHCLRQGIWYYEMILQDDLKIALEFFMHKYNYFSSK